MPGPLRGRLNVVVAAAGYGKTAAVHTWLRADNPVWYPEQAPGRVLVVDNAHECLPDDVGRPSRLVLVTRRPLPLPDLLRYDLGAPVEIGPRHLALPPHRLAAVLAGQYGVTDPDVAAAVHRLTGGWPLVTHLVGGMLASGADLDAATAPGTPVHDYVRSEVLATLPADVVEFLAVAGVLGVISADLGAAVGHDVGADVVALLARSGLLDPAVAGNTWYRPIPVVSAVAGSQSAMCINRRMAVVTSAARWCASNGRAADALRLAVAAADSATCAALIASDGEALLNAGAAAVVVTGARLLTVDQYDERIELCRADALAATGDTAAAVAVYSRLAGTDDQIAAGLAWRYGAAVYMWGDPHEALAVLGRGRLDSETTSDEAMLLAWTASAYWLAGDEPGCQAFADRAHQAALVCSDDRALAASYIARALGADLAGDLLGLQANYAHALELAERAGDAVQVLRVRVNLTAAIEQEGRLSDALVVLAPAIALAESAGYVASLALALANEGALLHRLGRLDDAAASYRRAVQLYRRMHSRKVAYPLTGLGDLHRIRGQLVQAKAAYLEALRVAEEDGNNRQGLVPALAGLAPVVAETDQGKAAVLAERAVEHARGHWVTGALLARARVSCCAGNRAAAHRDALAAVDTASQHRDRAGLAEALEVAASVADEPAQARRWLAEALTIWTETGAELDADRVRITLGRFPGAGSDQRMLGRLSESRLVAAGLAVPALISAPDQPLPVEINVLGGFTVSIGGVPVGPAGWQSRKARDLLRVLIARRGRPATRDELADLLWGSIVPADTNKVSHRLSVALSTLRAVLDPQRLGPADHFILASQTNIAADLGRLVVDVEELFAQASYGLRLRGRGQSEDAWAVLTAAERAYTGEVFADDPYPDWAQPLRSEARTTYLHVLRVLADMAERAGDVDDVVRYLHRILIFDPYDEQTHRDLISALAESGRHGEASRAFRRYTEAMSEIGVPVRRIPGWAAAR